MYKSLSDRTTGPLAGDHLGIDQAGSGVFRG